jgi:hypothetical protein
MFVAVLGVLAAGLINPEHDVRSFRLAEEIV